MLKHPPRLTAVLIAVLITLPEAFCPEFSGFRAVRSPLVVVGSEVEKAAMSATVIPLLTYDKLYPPGDLP